jgi:hypothetical protein
MMGARKALLVAINTYPSQPLKGCINDSRQVEAALKERFGFAESDIHILRERDATKANIQKELEWLVSGVQDGDVLLFHYSGHGTQVADDSQDEWECRDECLVPYDHDWNNPLRDDLLRRYFDRVPLNANLTAVMDCCHSGTIDKVILEEFAASRTYIAPKQLSTPIEMVMQIQALQQRRDEEFRAKAAPQLRKLIRSLPPDADVEAEVNTLLDKLLGVYKKNRFGYVNVQQNNVLLAACADSQTAADAYIDGDFHGAFTYHLFNALGVGRPVLSYGDLIARAADGMRRYTQTPQLECVEPLKSRLFLAPLG